MSVDEFMNSLSEEQQKKVRACKNADALIVLANNQDIPLPDEQFADNVIRSLRS